MSEITIKLLRKMTEITIKLPRKMTEIKCNQLLVAFKTIQDIQFRKSSLTVVLALQCFERNCQNRYS